MNLWIWYFLCFGLTFLGQYLEYRVAAYNGAALYVALRYFDKYDTPTISQLSSPGALASFIFPDRLRIFRSAKFVFILIVIAIAWNTSWFCLLFALLGHFVGGLVFAKVAKSIKFKEAVPLFEEVLSEKKAIASSVTNRIEWLELIRSVEISVTDLLEETPDAVFTPTSWEEMAAGVGRKAL